MKCIAFCSTVLFLGRVKATSRPVYRAFGDISFQVSGGVGFIKGFMEIRFADTLFIGMNALDCSGECNESKTARKNRIASNQFSRDLAVLGVSLTGLKLLAAVCFWVRLVKQGGLCRLKYKAVWENTLYWQIGV